MKALLLTAGLLLALGARAQTSAPAAPVGYRYATLYLIGSTWRLNGGQDAKPAAAADAEADSEVVKKLRSDVAALNYLDGRGWECISHSLGGGSSFDIREKYVLRRRVAKP